jgi:capsular exopolysaccharide synthesis family protein
MNSVAPRMLGLTGGNLALVTAPEVVERPTANRAATLKRLGRQAWRRRWLLLGSVAAAAAVGVLVTLLTPRQYASTARLQISRETSQVLTVGAISRDVSVGDQEFYQTQYGLLRSEALAERVARDVGVVDSPAFYRMFGRPAATPGTAEYARRNEIAGQILLDHVEIAPVRGSSLVDIRAKTPSAVLSQKIAQVWAQDFIASNLERRLDASSAARQFLEARLEQLRQRLEQSERLAVEYAAAQGIVNLPAAGAGSSSSDSDSGGPRSLMTDDLASLNAAHDTATADRIQAASRLASANSQPGASGEALNNRAINLLRKERADALAEDARLASRPDADAADVRAAHARVDALNAAIASEEARIRTSLQQSYQAAAAREQGLAQRVDALKGSLAELRRRAIQYNIYRRDADTNRVLYEGLLQRFKEISVAGALDSSNIAVVDPAKLADRPTSPRLIVNLALFVLLGAVLGGVGAIVLGQIDDAVTDPDGFEEKLGLPLLGATAMLAAQAPSEALKDPRSRLTEAYLVVEANLELSAGQGAPKSLAITSTRPREGRSTTAVALARTLARARRRVVLVDADLRSPSIHTAFGLGNGAGVSDLLSGSGEVGALLIATAQDGLSIVTAGPTPANPADLLLGERMAGLVKELQSRFDHVIVDAPPVADFADAPLIAAAVERVVYAVRADAAPAAAIRSALARLDPGRVAGGVLTMIPAGAPFALGGGRR